jgi:DNA-directed RNA polymerase specialized sigma subunit
MSSLEKAIQKFDRLSEKQRSKIARKMIEGAIQLETKAKTHSLRKA